MWKPVIRKIALVVFLVLACGVPLAWPISGSSPSHGNLTPGSSAILNPYAVNTVVTQAHNLGGTPDFVFDYLECVIAQSGYSIGDRIYHNNVDSASRGYSVAADGTNVYILTSNSSSVIMVKSTAGTVLNLTVADWKIVAIPYRLN